MRDQLSARGFSAFLPEVGMWSKRDGSMHVVRVPMFPGYLFVRDPMDKHSYVEMLKVRGIVRILEDGWKRLTPIPDEQLEAVERVHQANVPALPHAALHEGDRVRVSEGPLAGVEGVLRARQPRPGPAHRLDRAARTRRGGRSGLHQRHAVLAQLRTRR